MPYDLPPVTVAFVGVIVFLTALFHLRYSEHTVEYAPTILTTVGIFATFLGIALGLHDFNTANITESVPRLIDGLKTAMWASVFGVGGALTIKFRHYFIPMRRKLEGTGAAKGITAEDLAALLFKIQQALVGNDDSTLVSQLKLSRQDSNDRLDALKRSQQEALQKLSEIGSKQLVEALRDVVRDFNARITEQFGDNFKQLNLAVGKLVVWQDQYRKHIDQSVAAQAEIVASMQSASRDYSALVATSGAFTKTANDLSAVVSSLEVQKQQLLVSLKGLADLLSAASGSLPKIEAKVMDLTNQLSESVTRNQEVLGKALADNTLLIRNSIQGVGQDFEKINAELNKNLGDLVAKTKEQVTILDAALTEELTKSLTSLGRQLAAVSEKFVSDYEPLTRKLSQLVSAVR